MDRINNISQQLTSNANFSTQVHGKNPDDVVIVSALRSALSKAKRGPLKDTAPEKILYEVMNAVLKQTKVNPSHVEDLVVGNVLQPGAGAAQARMAQMLSNFPVGTSAMAINRLCSSGIESIAMVASKIKSGIIDCGMAAGVESMSFYDLPQGRYPKMSEEAQMDDWVKQTYIPDGMTSENVVDMFGLTRKELDEFAVNSHLKAANAQKMGYFKDEIVPIKCQIEDKDGKVKEEIAISDNGIRANSSMEALTKQKPAFRKEGGITTGGNSSQLTDGAAVVLLAR